jgi:hypothetical protein
MSKPAAFLSYVREVDGMGDVTRFREALELAVRERGFDTFEVFHDRLHILWGDDWKNRVLQSFDDIILIIPVISPGFFASENCRFEVNTFLERERQSGSRQSTILPVYFVDTPAFNNPGAKNDEIIALFKHRTYLDFRKLKPLPKEDITYRRQIDRAADKVAAVLHEQSSPPEADRAGSLEPLSVAEAEPPKRAPLRPRRFRLYGGVGGAIVAVCLTCFAAYKLFPDPVAANQEPALEPYEAECVIAETTTSFIGPDTIAAFGPTLGKGRHVQIVGKVPNTPWVAAREADQGRFYFPGTACMKRP